MVTSREDLGRAVLDCELSPAFAVMVGHPRVGGYLVEVAQQLLLGEPGVVPPHWRADVAYALHRAGLLEDESSPARVNFVIHLGFQELARRAAPPEPGGAPRPVQGAAPGRGLCGSCGRWIQLLGSRGVLRHHGPPRAACPGSGMAPAA